MDETVEFERRRTTLRYVGFRLGVALVIVPLLRMAVGGAGLEWLLLSLVGLLVMGAFVELGPDRIVIERHAIVVHGGSRSRAWNQRFERAEVEAAEVEGLRLIVDRHDGERFRYWLRSHDHHRLADTLRAWQATTA